jgi:hypothetical protein
MIAAGAKTAASIHGDQAGDNVAAYYLIDGNGQYIATPRTVYLNYIGMSTTGTAAPGTVTCGFEVYAFLDPLP